LCSQEALAGTSEDASSAASCDIGSFDLVRKFVEQVLKTNESTNPIGDCPGRSVVDWETVVAAVADCDSLEQAIGRAVVIADQMSRGLSDGAQLQADSSRHNDEQHFFAFSLADVDPDFGDESRYRTKVAKRVAQLLGLNRIEVDSTTGS